MTDHDPDAVPVRTADDWWQTVVDGESWVTVIREGVHETESTGSCSTSSAPRASAGSRWTPSERPSGATSTGPTRSPKWRLPVAANHEEDRAAPVERTLEHFMLQLWERDLIRLESAHT